MTKRVEALSVFLAAAFLLLTAPGESIAQWTVELSLYHPPNSSIHNYITLDASGNPHAAGTRPGGNLPEYAFLDGAQWQAEALDAAGAFPRVGSWAGLTTGFYYHGHGGSYEMHFRRRIGPNQWDGPDVLFPPSKTASYVGNGTFFRPSDNRMRIAFWRRRKVSGNKWRLDQLRYSAQLTVGPPSTWTTGPDGRGIVIDDQGTGYFSPANASPWYYPISVVQDSAGFVHIAYPDDGACPTCPRAKYVKIDDAGAIVIPAEEIATFDVYPTIGPHLLSLAVAGDGTPHVALADEHPGGGLNDVRHAVRLPGGSWALEVVAAAAMHTSNLALALDTSQHPVIAYSTAESHPKLGLAHFDGTTWEFVVGPSPAGTSSEGDDPWLTVDPVTNEVHAVSLGGGAGQVYHTYSGLDFP